MKKIRVIKVCMSVAIAVIIIFFMIITVDFMGFEKLPSIIRELVISKETPEKIGEEENAKSGIKLQLPTEKEEERIEKLNKNIVFSNTGTKVPYLTFNGKMGDVNITITDDGRTISFKTPIFTKLGDKVIVYYWITNNNAKEAKIGNLICSSPLSNRDKTSSNSVKEEIEILDNSLMITSKNELKGTTIAGGTSSSSTGTIEIELINVPESDKGDIINYEIVCEMRAN